MIVLRCWQSVEFALTLETASQSMQILPFVWSAPHPDDSTIQCDKTIFLPAMLTVQDVPLVNGVLLSGVSALPNEYGVR